MQKVLELESRKLASDSGKSSSHNDQLAEESNHRRLETLEAQLADITQKRLDGLERQQQNVQVVEFLFRLNISLKMGLQSVIIITHTK